MHTDTIDQNNVYSSISPINDEPWYNRRVFAVSAPAIADFDINPSEVFAAGDDASLNVRYWGGLDYPNDDEDHDVQLLWDGQVVASDRFDGIQERNLGTGIPANSLSNSHTVGFEVTADTENGLDINYIESVALTYPRKFVAINDRLSFEAEEGQFQISGFSSGDIVAYVQGASGLKQIIRSKITQQGGSYSIAFKGPRETASYYVSTVDAVASAGVNLMESESVADITTNHVVITHPDFMGPELDQYVLDRSAFAAGDMTVVNINDIYRHYTGGVVDANVITQFVSDLAAGNDLQSVLIVGGDSYDYKDYLGLSAISFVPAIYRPSGLFTQFTPVDALYGDINGDGIPEIPVGRLPARTLTEFVTIADKIIEFEARSSIKTSFLAADNTGPSERYDFTGASESVASILNDAGWSTDKAYLDLISIADARNNLLDALNDGVRLAVYTGHSATRVWTAEGLFSINDAVALTNYDAPSAVVQWGCFNTYFSIPTEDSLGHAFMLSGNQGAALVLGPSGIIDAHAEEVFADLFHSELLEPGTNVGEAMIRAKQQFAEDFNGNIFDILSNMTLLGDPLSSIQ